MTTARGGAGEGTDAPPEGIGGLVPLGEGVPLAWGDAMAKGGES